MSRIPIARNEDHVFFRRVGIRTGHKDLIVGRQVQTMAAHLGKQGDMLARAQGGIQEA